MVSALNSMVAQPNSPDNNPHADQAKAARASKLCVHGFSGGEVQKRKVWIRKLSRRDVLASAIWPANALHRNLLSFRAAQRRSRLRPARVSIEGQLQDD